MDAGRQCGISRLIGVLGTFTGAGATKIDVLLCFAVTFRLSRPIE